MQNIMQQIATQSTYLGPATVLKAAGDRVRIAFPNQEAWARMALAYRYEAREGDVLLVIGQDSQWYVIGVLQGQGPTTIQAPADLELRAVGRISLHAGQELDLRGPAVNLHTHALQVVATRVMEKFQQASRWIKETFHMSAQSSRIIVEESYHVQAGSIKQVAEEDVRIDGDKIHLG